MEDREFSERKFGGVEFNFLIIWVPETFIYLKIKYINMGKNEETAGEDLIADFLEEKAFNFKRYPIVPNLTEDSKFFREADFFLPEYKVYIEFLGQWNDPDHKKRYKQKMRAYYKNTVPCIYIWPDNLGTLEWILRRRLREVLLKYNKKFILFKYEWNNYTQEYGLILVGLGVLIYFVKSTGWKIGISLYLLLTLYVSIKKYVKRLIKIKKSKWVSGASYKEQSKKEEIKIIEDGMK